MAPLGEGYRPAAKCDHPEGLGYMKEDLHRSRLGTAKVEWVLLSMESEQPDGQGYREPSPD